LAQTQDKGRFVGLLVSLPPYMDLEYTKFVYYAILRKALGGSH